MSQFNQGQVTSIKQDYETPQDFFDYWNHIFSFDIDAAASADNTKCREYYDERLDGLGQDWGNARVWLNPPYGRDIIHWINKAFDASARGALVVCLVKFAPDTEWWDLVEAAKATVIRVRGRIKFGTRINAPFASAVVIFWPGHGPPSQRTGR